MSVQRIQDANYDYFEILNGICYCQTTRETHIQISYQIRNSNISILFNLPNITSNSKTTLIAKKNRAPRRDDRTKLKFWWYVYVYSMFFFRRIFLNPDKILISLTVSSTVRSIKK
jgi:hypothetical protein